MNLSLEQFLKNLGVNTQAEITLAIMYYNSFQLANELSPKEIRDAFEQASQPSPSNISQVLSDLRKRKLINKTKSGNYSLTIAGKNLVMRKAEKEGFKFGDEITVTVKEISESLQKKVFEIADYYEREYIEEAIRCLHSTVLAFRAAVLMGWTATIYHLRKKVEHIGFSNFNDEFRKMYPQSKRKSVNHIDDLVDYRDIELLEVCEKMHIYDKYVKKRLKHWLDLRNGCAHPTNINPEIHIVKAFFEEIIEYVLTK
ncbi:hypothetical protein GCM10010885_24640 [Alicyclobacillus cellulosilyticus]|uniref:Uncharacterized protein n=1 Tax=Alicyclobacillus cellulosilyticus TaxID=1003997 RepID=A0A917NNS2_9BACL|nr:hypothetical protein [Alicyclobacillus cellulosilyticus]GGJ14441.1 hypothetical protein GCM10010885_24640 [Alicyclobacillus cellulosilyticus]